ncbi:MAG: anhydro-N-acetylmuramic acid kinase [Bacteroidota bacterium]
MTKKEYKILGLMSGTSLDGLDMALCHFFKEEDKWQFKLLKTETIPYSESWINILAKAQNLNGLEFIKLHHFYGSFLGDLVNLFNANIENKPDYISSHGHTVFHVPHENITFQIGNGASIAASCNLPVVCDFRTLDVAYNGQGAPLVPIGDESLFSDYDYCLNIGGIANISYSKNNKRIAYDICPANMALNTIISRDGKTFDFNGETSSTGTVISGLLEKLNGLNYYFLDAPKSMGREWFEKAFVPILNEYFHFSTADLLSTVVEHIAVQIGKQIKPNSTQSKLLVTGGGAHNAYLMERIIAHTNIQIEIPTKDIIDFKEAIIFAFLGLLRIEEQNNCLSSVTGAQKDNCGGCIYMPIGKQF